MKRPGPIRFFRTKQVIGVSTNRIGIAVRREMPLREYLSHHTRWRKGTYRLLEIGPLWIEF